MKYLLLVLLIALWILAVAQGSPAPVIRHRVPEQRCPYPDWSLQHMGVDKYSLSCYGTTPA